MGSQFSPFTSLTSCEAASSPILVPFLNGNDSLPCHDQPLGCVSGLDNRSESHGT